MLNRLQPSFDHEPWVHLTEDGSFNGRVLLADTNRRASTVGSTRVLIRNQSGATQLSQTDSYGRFKFAGLQPGIYSLIVGGENAFASVAVHVLPAEGKLDSGFPSFAEISAARIQNATVKDTIETYMPPSLTANTPSIETENFEQLAEHIYGTELSQVAQVNGGNEGDNIWRWCDWNGSPDGGQHTCRSVSKWN